MRTRRTFRPSAVDRLEARDVPSAMAPDVLVRGNPAPPAHSYPVGVITPYFVAKGHASPPSHAYPVGVIAPF